MIYKAVELLTPELPLAEYVYQRTGGKTARRRC